MSDAVTGLRERLARAASLEEKRELLMALKRGAAASPAAPSRRPERPPLSFAQIRMWFLNELEAGSVDYVIPGALMLSGDLDRAALAAAARLMTQRHEALRTVFPVEDGRPWQRVLPSMPVEIPCEDLRDLPADRRLAAARRAAAELGAPPFGLDRGPLLRLRLSQLDDRRHVLAIALHHIIADGLSIGLLLEELGAAYGALAAGRQPDLPDLPVQCVDIALAEHDALAQGRWAGQERFWRDVLADLPETLNLPTDLAPPAERGSRGGRVPLRLPDAAEQACRTAGLSPFMLQLAALAALLFRITGDRDVCIGVPVAGRLTAGAERLIGLFANTLPMRLRPRPEMTVAELLAQAKSVTGQALANQDLPLTRLIEMVGPERDLQRNSLFRVLLAAQPPLAAGRFGPLEAAPFAFDFPQAKFDLTFILEDQGGWLEYAEDLFVAATARRLAGLFSILVAAMAGAPQTRLDALPVMDDRERSDLIERFGRESGPLLDTEPRCLHAWFRARARLAPDAVAVEAGGTSLTYGELDRRSDRLAGRLHALGARPETRVAVACRRTPDLLVALLAVLKSGAAYVPIDPSHPAERIGWILADAKALALITDGSLASSQGCGVLVGVDEAAELPAVADPPPAAMAYVIYTSGSTGKPKGVAVSHANADLLLRWALARFRAADFARSLFSSSVCFDLSVFEIFVPLSGGGTVVMAENALDLLEGDWSGLTLINTVPSAARELARQNAIPDSVRVFNLAGEALPPALAASIYAGSRVESVNNLWGPAEDTTYSSGCTVRRGATFVTLGRPLPKSRVYILDPSFNPVPVGVFGEIFVAGPNLTRGYLDRPGLTAERFLPDPFAARPGGRMYRTGDRGRWRADGEIEFAGRLDHQVKLRGFRVECGEVEAELDRQPGVRASLVTLRDDGAPRLVAYVVGGEGPEAWRAALAKKLPDYMIPSAFVQMDRLPLNPNGKVDRKALPAPEASAPEGAVEPRTPEEASLAAIWGDLLRLPRVGVFDNFFALGGDSILGMQVVSRARQAGLALTAKDVFRHQTVAALAAAAPRALPSPAVSAAPRVERSVPLSAGQAWLLGRNLAQLHWWNQSLTLRLGADADRARVERALSFLADHHEALRARFVEEEDGWRQIIMTEPAPLAVETIGPEGCAALQAGLDPAIGRLMRAGWLAPERGEGPRLLLVIHHLAVDGVSWRVLVDQLEIVHAALKRGEVPVLPDSGAALWEPGGEVPAWTTAEDDIEGEARTLALAFDPAETRDLLAACRGLKCSVEEALLAALAAAIGDGPVVVERHGRGGPGDLSSAVGWYTSFEACRPARGLAGAKRAIRAPAAAGVGATACLNYFGRIDIGGDGLVLGLDDRDAGPRRGPRNRRPFAVDVNAALLGDRFSLVFACPGSWSAERAQAALAVMAGELRGLGIVPAAAALIPEDFPLCAIAPDVLARVTGHPDGLETIHPLTPTQQGMLFHTLAEPEARVYVEHARFTVAPVSGTVLRDAWRCLAREEPMLRACVLMGPGIDEPLMVVRRAAGLEPAMVTDLAPDEIEALGESDHGAALVWDRAPLMRVTLCRLGDDRWRVLWTFHHLLLDGWSLSLLAARLSELCRLLSAGTPRPPAAPSKFEDYLRWRAGWPTDAAQAFWRDRLAGFSGGHWLGIERPVPGPRRDPAKVAVPVADGARLAAFCRRNGLTLNTALQGAWAMLLARYARRRDVVFGVTFSGRSAPLAGIERMVGLFINTVPLRLRVDPGADLVQWLRDLQALNAELRDHEHASQRQIRGWAGLSADTALFHSILVFENYPVQSSGGLEIGDVHLAEIADHPLAVLAAPGEILAIALHYDRARYEDGAIAALGGHFGRLIDSLDQARRVGDCDPLPAAERAQLLAWGTGAPAPAYAPVTGRLAETARRHADRAAVLDGERIIGHRAFASWTDRLAAALRRKGIGPDVLAGLCLPSSAEAVAGLVAIVKAGGAYVPLDPDYPAPRLESMLADSNPRLVVTDAGHADHPVLRGRELVLIDAPLDDAPAIETVPAADDLAYVIFTSGSTGRPKGVACRHGGLANLVSAQIAAFGLAPGRRVLQFASLNFDASVWEIFATLASGAALAVGPRAAMLPGGPLEHTIRRHRVTNLTITPSALAGVDPDGLPSLETVVLAGEASPRALLDRWSRACRVVNAYGPTETTVCASMIDVAEMAGGVSIGRPLPGTRLLVLDEMGRPMPIGVPGALHVGGAGLARGYLGRADLTADRFVPDPQRPGERLYRTGDLACWSADGQLEFRGRDDAQVKIRGFRIETDEVKAALLRHPAVRDCAVVARDDAGIAPRLVAYVVGGALPAAAELRAFLAAILPDFMLPAAFVVLGALPLTRSDKVDVSALPPPGAVAAVGEVPATEDERKLASIWSEVLRQAAIGRRSNFFDLGGDSIAAIQVAARAAGEGLALRTGDVLAYPVLADQAVRCAVAAPAAADDPCEGGTTLTLSPIQRWFFGLGLSDWTHWNQSLVLTLPGPVGPEAFDRALSALALRHPMLRARISADGIEIAAVAEDYRLPPGGAADRQASLDPARGRCWGGALLAPDRAFLMAHHLVVDGVSWRILVHDLECLLTGRALAPMRNRLRDWAAGLARLAVAMPDDEARHWRDMAAEGPGTRLPLADPAGDASEGAGANAAVGLSEGQTAGLFAAAERLRAKPQEMMVAALALALTRSFEGPASWRIDVESHGRDALPEVDIGAAVGWFTLFHPVRIDCDGVAGSTLAAARAALRRAPAQGRGWLMSEGRGNSEILFNYLGGMAVNAAAGETGPDRGAANRRPHELAVNLALVGGRLVGAISYSTPRLGDGAASALAEALVESLSEIAALPAPDSGPAVEQVLPLGPAQHGMLFHCLREPNSGLYFQEIRFKARGLDRDAFRAAWQATLDDEPALRAAFPWQGLEQPMQIIHCDVVLPVTRLDWSDLPAAEAERRWNLLSDEARRTGFDLAEAPLLRLVLIERGAHETWVSLLHHHILLDGWSLAPLMARVIGHYRRRPPPRRQSVLAAWHALPPSDGADYWRAHLAAVGAPARLVEFESAGRATAERVVVLSEALTAAARAAARREQTTFNTWIQALWTLVLSRFHRRDDVLFGVVVSGRSAPVAGLETAIGLFINTLPLRVRLPARPGASSLLAVTGAAFAGHLDHERTLLSDIGRWTGVRLAEHFDSALVVENYPLSATLGEDPGFEVHDAETRELTNFPLTVVAVPERCLEIRLRYDPARIGAARVGRICDLLRQAAESLAGEGGQSVEEGPDAWDETIIL